MSIIRIFEDPLEYRRTSLLSNQRFGLGLDDEDLFSVSSLVPRRVRRLINGPYFRNWSTRESRREHGFIRKSDKKGYHVNLDVQQFAPEEISVKVSGENTITVEGKHEEKEDDHGFISRHFVRKYTIPKHYDIGKVASKLSSDGVLTITAPKIEEGEEEYREIPILQTGAPALLKRKSESDEEENGVSQMDISEECHRQKKTKTK